MSTVASTETLQNHFHKPIRVVVVSRGVHSNYFWRFNVTIKNWDCCCYCTC